MIYLLRAEEQSCAVHRPSYRMKSQTQYFAILVLLVGLIGLGLLIIDRQGREPQQVFPATVTRDCAPWDGGAFTISIPYDAASVIAISIWQSPAIESPSTFSVPDEAAQVGNASLITEPSPPRPLYGEVSFQRVSQETPVEGRFNFRDESGKAFEGKFIAAWDHRIVYCG